MLFSYLKSIFLHFFTFLSSLILLLSPTSSHARALSPTQYQSTNLTALTPAVLKEAINAYLYAQDKKQIDKSILTVINFAEPSFKKRMWVIDVTTGQVLLSMHVAQGKGSGLVYAKHFSNQPGSKQSSTGVFATSTFYSGKHGKSMRVLGLEPGINSDALRRAVVIHPAPYVSPSFISQHGYAGRSWGCFAIDPSAAPTFFKAISGQTALFAYAAPENKDPIVNHALSDVGQAIFQRIESHLGNSESGLLWNT